MELCEPLELGPTTLKHLSLSLPGLRFPVDLSRGVRPFRHRRGRLESATLSASLAGLEAWLALRLSAVSPRTPSVWRTSSGIGVGVSTEETAWAFELLWAPDGRGGRLIVANPRAGGVQGPALGGILQLLDTALGPWCTRSGRIFHFADVASALCAATLPTFGARCPRTDLVGVGDIEGEGDELLLRLGANVAVPPNVAALRALEFGRLVSAADDALLASDADRARSLYMAALEKAPRHVELTRTVAEIDVWFAERAEAALALITECMPASHSGAVGAELLARVGDVDGAREATRGATAAEAYGPVAALQWRRLAELSTTAPDRMTALDLAVASCPGLLAVRKARFEERARQGELSGALADAEHMEGMQRGAERRHRVLTDSAARLLEYGFVAPAGKLFERALRYLPRHAPSALGLAQSFIATGKFRRAAVLLERAAELATDSATQSAANLEFGKLLAVEFRDLPGAVARVQRVVADSGRVVEARALEGRWRAELGDLVGASVAYARLREACELARAQEPLRAADWLVEAAAFESQRGELRAAERHLAVALRLRPHDARIGMAYRVAAEAVSGQNMSSSPSRQSDEELAEILTQRFLSAPWDAHLLPQLVSVLERLGKEEELLALLTSQREDAAPELAAQLTPHLARVLERLLQRASIAGEHADAEVYRELLAALS